MDGKRYFDFLSGYSAVNQGHCHPKASAATVLCSWWLNSQAIPCHPAQQCMDAMQMRLLHCCLGRNSRAVLRLFGHTCWATELWHGKRMKAAFL